MRDGMLLYQEYVTLITASKFRIFCLPNIITRKLNWQTVESFGLHLGLKMAKEVILSEKKKKATRRLEEATLTNTFKCNLHIYACST